MFKMAAEARAAAIAAFKRDRSTFKGKITGTYNKANETMAQGGPLEQAQMGLSGAKQHLKELLEALAKMKTYLNPAISEDAEAIKEGDEYVQPSVTQVDELKVNIPVYVKYMTMVNQVNYAMKHVEKLRDVLDDQVKNKASQADIQRASTELETFNDKLKPALAKLQKETTDPNKVAKYTQWEKENHPKVRKALDAAEECIEELKKLEQEKDALAKKHVRQHKLEIAVDCTKELASLVARVASKPKLRRARKEGEIALEQFKDAHTSYNHYITISAEMDAAEAAYNAVKGDLDKALNDVIAQLDERIDETSDTTSAVEHRAATGLNVTRQQDADRQRQEQVDRDRQMAENLQRKLDEGIALRNQRAIEKDRILAEFDAADKALDGIRLLMGSTGGSQHGDLSAQGLPQRTQPGGAMPPIQGAHPIHPPLATGAAMDATKVSRTKDYCLNARSKGSWIRILLDKGDPTSDPKYDCVRGSIKAELDVYDGDPDKWDDWSRTFEGLVHNTGKFPGEKLTLLKRFMRKPKFEGDVAPYNLIHNLTDYLQALGKLENRYNNPAEKRQRQRDKLRAMRSVPNSEAIEGFANDVCGLLWAMEADPYLNVEDTILDVVKKLPKEDRLTWRRYLHQLGDVATLSQFCEWLEELARDHREPGAVNKPNTSKKDSFNGKSARGARGKWKNVNSNAAYNPQPSDREKQCGACGKGVHELWRCDLFKKSNMEQRWIMTKRNGSCFNCLNRGHARGSPDCKAPKQPCKQCNGQHHFALHQPKDGYANAPPNVNPLNVSAPPPSAPPLSDGNAVQFNSGAAKVLDITAKPKASRAQVALGLANVLMKDLKGDWIDVLVFVDNGSETSMAQEKLMKRTGNWAKRRNGAQTTICGVGGANVTITSYEVTFQIYSTEGEEFTVTAITGPKITGLLNPINWAVEKMKFPHLRKLPIEYTSNQPQILIGTDCPIFHRVLESRWGGLGDPWADLTVLGWVIRGPTRGQQVERNQVRVNHACVAPIEDRAQMFYEAERFGTEHKSNVAMSADDQKAYDIIEQGIRKLDGPGYEVALPWRTDAVLPDNRKVAERRLQYLMLRLSRDKKDLADYSAEISKYVDKDFAKVIYKYDRQADPATDQRSEPGQHFLPHQGVRKRHGGKMRAVFDASATAYKDGPSLNKFLYVGPKLQAELPNVLTRLREDDVAYSADITAMFSQIRLREEDARKHRFLWEFPEDKGKVSVIQMNRVAFGDGPSPCIAIHTVRRTAKDFGGEHPEATEVINNGFYVDDLCDSCPNVMQANERAEQITSILAKGDFHLAGWKSNDLKFTSMQGGHDQPETKVLGMRWHLVEDVLRHVLPNEEAGVRLTKRGLLSIVASLFSPLGLASPLIIKAKIRIKQLHLWGLGWDDDISKEHPKEAEWWYQWIAQVPVFCEIAFPRCLRPNTLMITQSELHTFCDASEEGFAAVAYVRNMYHGTELTVRIVSARTRVGPKKAISVAKMELNAALLGTRLADGLTKALRFPIAHRFFWTDSSCVRQWVRATSTHYKAFVANRIGEIQELTAPHEWRHVPGKINVADIATRSELAENDKIIPEQWIHGPDFLYEDPEDWPPDIMPQTSTEEIRPRHEFKVFANAVMKEKLTVFCAAYHSRLWRLVRIRAWMHRLARRWRLREQQGELPEGLSGADVRAAILGLLREAQEEDFPAEMAALRDKEEVGRRSRVLPLTPFLDTEGLMRAHGRLGQSVLGFDERHPIILSPKNQLTKLIINNLHESHNHAESNMLHSILRRRYHVLGGREAVKRFYCWPCRKEKAKTGQQLMVDLPHERVNPYPPFFHTSLDYFGPYTIWLTKNISDKRYGCIYTCMVTRAIHIEVAASLSSEDFLIHFRTFCNTRGQPRTLYSDNGLNFVGAERRMREEFLFKDITWKFQPPYAPHWGGVHESLVKSVKMAMEKALLTARQVRRFTEIELRSLFAEVMGFLNGRPLTYQSSNPVDGVALTPNHFLIGRPGMEIPNGAFEPSRLGDHYEHVQATANDVWKLWTQDYLPTLLKRSKWRFRERNLQVHDVVLVVDNALPRNQWEIARVIEVYPGMNESVRSARVRILNGNEYEKPITKLCLLEKAENEDRAVVAVPDLGAAN